MILPVSEHVSNSNYNDYDNSFFLKTYLESACIKILLMLYVSVVSSVQQCLTALLQHSFKFRGEATKESSSIIFFITCNGFYLSLCRKQNLHMIINKVSSPSPVLLVLSVEWLQLKMKWLRKHGGTLPNTEGKKAAPACSEMQKVLLRFSIGSKPPRFTME